MTDPSPWPTPFPELNAVLSDLSSGAAVVLGDNFVGTYLHGSFAAGGADEYSDCDFVVVVDHDIDAGAAAALRTLHRDLYERPGYWNRNLEGAYAPRADLRTLDGIGRPWLSVDHGGYELEWSTTFNDEITRWDLREHGVAIAGPEPRTLVGEVGPDAIRAKMRDACHAFLPALLGWTTLDVSWSQRYAVTTLCRFLYNFHTGAVSRKHEALEWVATHADPRWTPLARQAATDRANGWDEDRPARPGAAEETEAFARYVIAVIEAGGLLPVS